MRRDNPAIPNDYYVNNFISGLADHIQQHSQCHKPTDMQSAMWMARRLEQVTPVRRAVTTITYYQQPVRRSGF